MAVVIGLAKIIIGIKWGKADDGPCIKKFDAQEIRKLNKSLTET